jgi:kumamolisin
MAHHILAGSERRALPGSTSRGKADPDERVSVSILLKRPDSDALAQHLDRIVRGERGVRPLTRADFARRFGARAQDIATVRGFAARYGLAVDQESPERRTVVVSGSVAQCNAAFGVDLQQYERGAQRFRGRVGNIGLPDDMHTIVDAVLGLDNRPQARTHYRRRDLASPAPGASGRPRAAAAAATSFTPLQLAALYDFPPSVGQGQTIGLIELGGGYQAAAITAYFHALGIAPPLLRSVSVDGGTNAPTGSAGGPDGEVELDIEVAGAVVPSAAIVAYFAPNTDAGFIDAVSTAIHDAGNQPTVISISWGGPESDWTQQALTAMDQAFQDAAALGITVCVACGDNGSSDGVTDGAQHVDFPASSSFALACGGTSLRAAGGTIASETVWNDGTEGGASGGGVSQVFALPAWQQGLKVVDAAGTVSALARRGVPDVSADADPQTGYEVNIDGSVTVIGGTSAVAPLWAGLIARINATRGAPVGLVQPRLYPAGSAFNDITQGNNGGYAAAPGWDACTGLGSPKGMAIAAALGRAAQD